MKQREETRIEARESVVFFPTCAEFTRDANGAGQWMIPIHGWIYRRGELSRLRRTAFGFLKRLAGVRFPGAGADFSTPLFRQRLQAFLADNQRNNRMRVELGGRVFTLKKSRADGHFEGSVVIPAECAVDGRQAFRAVMRPDDPRVFKGQAHLLADRGLSVISDIDDTVKVTEVRNRRRMLRNTFLREFQSVPDMASLYRHWASAGAAFHYVSASPWHLYPFLAEFLAAQDFPAGSFHLRTFRLMPRDIRATLRSSARCKRAHARKLLGRFPGRSFILVGDSGESDAAMYAAPGANTEGEGGKSRRKIFDPQCDR